MYLFQPQWNKTRNNRKRNFRSCINNMALWCKIDRAHVDISHKWTVLGKGN